MSLLFLRGCCFLAPLPALVSGCSAALLSVTRCLTERRAQRGWSPWLLSACGLCCGPSPASPSSLPAAPASAALQAGRLRCSCRAEASLCARPSLPSGGAARKTSAALPHEVTSDPAAEGLFLHPGCTAIIPFPGSCTWVTWYFFPEGCHLLESRSHHPLHLTVSDWPCFVE